MVFDKGSVLLMSGIGKLVANWFINGKDFGHRKKIQQHITPLGSIVLIRDAVCARCTSHIAPLGQKPLGVAQALLVHNVEPVR